MSQIEVPDWVARKVLAGYLRDWDDCSESNKRDLAKIMAESLTAALGAWVVPAGYRVSIPSEPELGHWLEDIGEVTHPDSETHTTIYVLRQEKPE